MASRSLRARSTHTSPPATTTAFGRLPTLIVRATRPATAGTWSPAGVVVAVVGVLEDAGVPPRRRAGRRAATTASATTGIAASAQTQAGRRPARRGPGSARTVGAWSGDAAVSASAGAAAPRATTRSPRGASWRPIAASAARPRSPADW